MRGGKPLSSITLDVDGLPIETFGNQAGTDYNRYVGCTHYSPLVASIAETGDMVGGLLRKGNSGNAAQADRWIPGLVQRIRQTTGAQPYLKRPAGRPPQQLREWCHEFYYKAESWEQHRRIVLVVSERPDDLFLHHFFLATSLDSKDWHGHEVLSLYRKRIKAGSCAKCVNKS